MKLLIRSQIILFILFSICIYSAETKLQCIKTINVPDEFYSITDFAVINSEDIVMIDGKGGQIYFKGKVKSIKGQAPGEAIYPRYLVFDRDTEKVVLCDSLGEKLNIYAKNLIFAKQINIKKNIYSIACSSGQIYLSFRLMGKEVDAFSEQGNFLGYYKQKFDFDPNKLSSFLSFKIAADKNNVFLIDPITASIIKLDNNLIVENKLIKKRKKEIDKYDKNLKVSSPFDPKMIKIANNLKKISVVVDACFSKYSHFLILLKQFKNSAHCIEMVSPTTLETVKVFQLKNNTEYSRIKCYKHFLYLLNSNGTAIDVYSF